MPRNDIYYPVHCHYTDLHSLNVSRFWRHTVPLGVETGILLCVILQALVLIIVSFRNLKSEERKWFWRWGWADFITDLVHLMLLAVIGSCMMEAVGHSNLHICRTSIMYNAGAVYSYLTAFAMVSSFLRQLAMCFDDNHTLKVNVEDSNPQHGNEKRPRPWDKAVKGLKDVTDDWSWQRVFCQVAVVVRMGTYLGLVDDDTGSSMDNLAGIMLAAVVASSIWSAATTAVVALRALDALSRMLFAACPPGLQQWWLSALSALSGSCL